MQTIKIGWAKREFSMEEPVAIPGQMHLRISTGIHDPLLATALCIDGGQDKFVFCVLDMTCITESVYNGFYAKLAESRPDIPEECVILSATHTHTSIATYDTPERAPDGTPIYPGKKCAEHVVNMALEAVCEAWDTRKEGGVAYGYGYAVTGHSRRTVYLNDVSQRYTSPFVPHGRCVMYGKTDDPEFSHYEAGSDAFLNVMFTFDSEKKLTGVVVNTPCPSQVMEMYTQQSADYWNEVRQNVADIFGSGVFVLPQCAPAGDLAPRLLHYLPAQTRRFTLKYDLKADVPKKDGSMGIGYYNSAMSQRRDIAERITQGVQEVYSWAKKEIYTQIPVYHVRKKLLLKRREITDEDRRTCAQTLERMKKEIPSAENATAEEYQYALSRYESARNRNERILRLYDLVRKEPEAPYYAHFIRIGDIAFATNPFELYMDFMHRIQARSPFIQTFLIQLASNDGSGGYLPTKRAVENKSYGASVFDNQVSYEGGQQLVEATVQALSELHARTE